MVTFPEKKIQLQGAYYLESQNPNMNPIAIRFGACKPNYVYWEDTGNGRIVHAAKLIFDGQEIKENSELKEEKIPDIIEFTSTTGENFKLVKLTVKLFNEKLKPFVAKGETLDFKSDEQVQNHYLGTDFYSAG